MKIKNEMYLMCCVDTRWGGSDINFLSHRISPPPLSQWQSQYWLCMMFERYKYELRNYCHEIFSFSVFPLPPPVSFGTLCHICTHRHIYDFTIISTFIFLSALILWHFNIFHILIFFHSPPTPPYDIHFHIIYVNFVFFHIHIGIFLPMFF